jgi:3-hydroxyacyl-CoA dehydrogenase / enoyl-CoA hydratase / 3-hydroxybutyryl-CoA epimerase / enoyl-CoA isomerase
VLAAITPTLEYNGFDDVDCVVENQNIKGFVLAEVEKVLPKHAVVTSNI